MLNAMNDVEDEDDDHDDHDDDQDDGECGIQRHSGPYSMQEIRWTPQCPLATVVREDGESRLCRCFSIQVR